MRMRLDNELCEIVQDGARLLITADGKQTVRKFISADHAKIQHDKLVGEKLAAGWQATDEAPSVHGDGEPREPTLEAAITADPYDTSAYAVYGDWYQARHHPRGELIALQLAEEARDDDALKAATRKHLARYKAELLGELARFSLDRASPFGWRFGFIHRLELDDAGSAAALIREVMCHPSGRVLAEARLRLDDPRYLAEALVQLGPNLRELAIVTIAQIVNLQGLARFDKLRKLSLKSYGPMPRPRALAGIAKLAPTLESLALRVYGDEPWVDLAPLFARTDLTLRHFRIRSEQLVDPALRALAEGPLATGLESLDIAQTDPDDGIRALLANRERFAKLRVLTLSFDRVVPKAMSALRATIPKLVDSRQDPDDPEHEDFYDEVVE